MLTKEEIEARLHEMESRPDPMIKWDGPCEGSARALVVFVGPSPGGDKPESRHPMSKDCWLALWNKPYDAPRTVWSPGFKKSFGALIKALFEREDFTVPEKLIGRANLDWVGNPNSIDVQERDMIEGAPSALRMIADCAPELVLPMDTKTFRVLTETVLPAHGFEVTPCTVKNFLIRIPPAKKRVHRYICASRAKSSNGRDFLVIKLPQHPARTFNAEYAKVCGEAVREAALQIASGQPVDVTKG